jgi:hypothetical protein
LREGGGSQQTVKRKSNTADETRRSYSAEKEALSEEAQTTDFARESPKQQEQVSVRSGQATASEGAGSGAQTRAEPLPTLDTRTIKTGEISVGIEEGTFNQKYGSVVAVAEGAGGYVSDSRTNSSDGRIDGGTITIRVPTDRFSEVMNKLKEMGEVTSISESAEDITEEYVDLEARIKHLRAQEAVYLDLMAKAQTIQESITVQRELSVVQEQIEQLAGRRDYLENHATLSTVAVSLVEPGAGVAGPSGGGWGLAGALSDAAHGFMDGLNTVIRFLGNALIYIILLGVVAMIAYMVIKKRDGGEAAPGQ